MMQLRISADPDEVRAFGAGLGKLTPRELQIAQGTLHGQSAKEMAAQLGISYRTVEVHRTRAFSKLSVSGVVDFFRLSAFAFMREAATAAVLADRVFVQERLANFGSVLAA